MRRLLLALTVAGLLAVTGCGGADEHRVVTGPPQEPVAGFIYPTNLTVPPTTAVPTTRRRGRHRSTCDAACWHTIAECETGGKMDNPDTGNGYSGDFQFGASDWRSAGGGPGKPSDYSYEEQRRVAERWAAMRGMSAWPTCRHRAGV